MIYKNIIMYLSIIYNASFIYFELDKRECKCLEYVFIIYLLKKLKQKKKEIQLFGQKNM
jgi:hypothetical protein